MQNVYIFDASTFAALMRACIALKNNSHTPDEAGRLLELLLARGMRATLEMDSEGMPCLS